MRIVAYTEEYKRKVIDLILGIQRKEFGIAIDEKDQPDLSQINKVYQQGNGNFWIALNDEEVCGSIALLDIGHSAVALRKMFVDSRQRGSGIAQQLMNVMLGWCEERNIKTIYLGTIDVMKAAHRFYEKNGFTAIDKGSLPVYFPLMKVDNVFYKFSFNNNS